MSIAPAEALQLYGLCIRSLLICFAFSVPLVDSDKNLCLSAYHACVKASANLRYISNCSTGWLRYENGTAKGQTRDLTVRSSTFTITCYNCPHIKPAAESKLLLPSLVVGETSRLGAQKGACFSWAIVLNIPLKFQSCMLLISL